MAQAQFLENACDATRLLGKRRQLFDMKELFAAEKEKYDERCKALAQKDAELTERDLEFQAKLVRLKIFSRENESKHKKLAKRRAEEVKLCEDLDEEAASQTASLKEKQQQLKELEKAAQTQKKYLDLLGNNDISDVMDKYELLKVSRERMEVKLMSIEAAIEAEGTETDQLQDAEPETVSPQNQNSSSG